MSFELSPTLGFDELRLASGGIGSVQRAVAGRVFRAVGPGAALVRPVHEAVTRSVYAGLGLGTMAIGRAAAAAVDRRMRRRCPRRHTAAP